MIEKDGHLIQSFRKRRDEYSIPLRKESWEKLEIELLSRSVFRRRMYRWISIAAVMLICLTLSIPYNKESLPHKGIIPQMHIQQKQQTILAIAPTSVPSSANRKIPDEIVETETKEESLPILNELPAEEIILIEEETEKPENVSFAGPQQEKRTNKNYAIPPATKNKQQHKWTFGLSAGSNNPKGSPSEQTINKPGITDPPYTGPDYEGGIGEGEGKGEEITRYNYHHRIPLSIGISAQKKLSNHFGLESGLTYTYLYSDINEEGMIAEYAGNQRLHYLGIPLKANWLLYNQKHFSIYLSGGTLLEYCLSADRKINNQKEKPDFNRFQVSLNAAAGMQLVLTKPLSVFIEPGVSYFIDNGNTIETIRTDNPFMFNLQVGVRFTY
ncbi:MAG: porin family protein [Tannerellaceae bacterium]|jgi:hypothetical protein|nr:porin family protein [Tannerellaceae bacterium]